MKLNIHSDIIKCTAKKKKKINHFNNNIKSHQLMSPWEELFDYLGTPIHKPMDEAVSGSLADSSSL